MKKLVVFYSYTGNTEKLAKAVAAQEGAALCKVEAVKRPGTVKAYLSGSFGALRQKPWPIKPLGVTLSDYDHIILMAPVWAGFPAPPINSVVEALPAGKDVEVYLVSASGQSRAKDKLYARISARGCKIVKYKDQKS